MNAQAKHILITGASGFIGSHLVEAALADGFKVWAQVRKTSSRKWLADKRLHFIETDLSDKKAIKKALVATGTTFNGVLHCAGVTKVRRREDFFNINTSGTRHLAEALIETGKLEGRFVYFSSLSVMGDLREHPYPYIPFKQTDCPCPNTDYGRSKLEAERALSTTKGLDYVVLRPTGVYGPRERDYYMMAQSIKRHIDFSVGYRPQELTFIYVKDLAHAALLALEHGPSKRAYFLTDGNTYNSRCFSDLLQAEMGVRRVVHIKTPLWVLRSACAISGTWASIRGKAATLNMDKFRIMRQRNWKCDISATNELLGFLPQYDLEQGVKETVNWCKEEGWL
ncbi:MAG: NAD(P)-dependent oxidoreductase [Bacteroidaceae bacterium]|nr:NAD(P)-dependent oxidoreductase [Bacteroidaceae bacterium]